MKQWLKERPWIWIVVWFIIVILVWAWFIPYTKKIGFMPVPIETEARHE